ncbi:hypothetical protein CIRG_05346 [Coccidioides immitis RMSCC 2394]|uniref:Uncharacterized protein n=1 Tax=Coccidioides immitis RMSCC 2394 TaxID=404692 RepID=A0A0J6YD94_COCIT|nr:hypothetical protein CIRG_05346 [Coccidioides immitis RMSCC 2394]
MSNCSVGESLPHAHAVVPSVVNTGEVSASPPTTVPFFHLDDCHARRVIQALRRILATEVAEESFSMLIDGRLTMKALRACRRIRLGEDYDEIAKYTGPSQDTISMFRSLREQFDLSHVLIKASSAERFQRSDVQASSADFQRGLLDLVVSMVHDLAVSIFEELHRSKYQNTPHQGPERALLPDFRHPKYLQSYLYPHGPIELVGYWMETRLFGGVVVFEHGNPLGEPGAPWIHFPYEGIMRMSDKQLDAFTQLAFTISPVSDAAAVSNLLPFKAEPDAQYVDSFDAYKFGLFRNCFERNPPPNISRFSCTAMGRNVTYPDWVRLEPPGMV